jgi:hypothetical protein
MKTKEGLVFLLVAIVFLSLTFVLAQDESEISADVQDDFSSADAGIEDVPEPETFEEIYSDIGDVELQEDAGLTPDSALYFVDEIIESVFVGDNPERALRYKEEKIAEVRQMVEEGKVEEAEVALEKVDKYSEILEEEVSPDIERRVRESSKAVKEVIEDLDEDLEGTEWDDVRERIEEHDKREDKIAMAAELASKINELCETLAKLDPLQYADVCRAKDDSPNWLRERDRELTQEQSKQAEIFFDKLSECFEEPEDCDCSGMGVQSFEDFCVEQSGNAVACFEGDKDACMSMEQGASPEDLLPDYLVDVFYKVEEKYSRSKFDNFLPPECERAGATSPEECNEIMFKLHAPRECIEAGLTGESMEDERKCGDLMFKMNTPQECIDAGIDLNDPDAPRKCAQIMFKLHAPMECVQAGITGERRDDDMRCKELMESQQFGGGFDDGFGPQKFERDCNTIQDVSEKVRCFEQFYNNAQMNFRDDFMEREMSTRSFAENMGAANPENPCPDGVCDQYESSHPGECPEDCGGVRREDSFGYGCQTPEQIERLKQDCIRQGEGAVVEDRGGCPWVICVREETSVRTYSDYESSYGDYDPYQRTVEEPVYRDDVYERPPEDYYEPPKDDYYDPTREPEYQEPYQEPASSDGQYVEPDVSYSEPAPTPEPGGESPATTESTSSDGGGSTDETPATDDGAGITGGVISGNNAFLDYWSRK